MVGLGLVAACSKEPKRPRFTFPGGSLYYGASTPIAKLSAFEATLGLTLSCYRSYFEAGQEGLLLARVKSDLALGRMPIPSIKPPGPWADSAKDIGWLERLLGPLGDVDEKIFLSVHHEPENDAASYGGAADYVALQAAVLEQAARVARNVVVVPVVAAWSFDERAERVPQEWNVRDAPVYGLDLYNPWSPDNGKDWVPFEERLDLAEVEAHGRPILVAEYGCRTDASQPGRAASWMNDAFEAALASDVIGMAYFNSSRNSPDGTWELDSETFPVFAELLARPNVTRI